MRMKPCLWAVLCAALGFAEPLATAAALAGTPQAPETVSVANWPRPGSPAIPLPPRTVPGASGTFTGQQQQQPSQEPPARAAPQEREGSLGPNSQADPGVVSQRPLTARVQNPMTAQ